MSFGVPNPNFLYAAPAAADYSTTGQCLGVVLNASGQFVKNTAAGGKIFGVLIDNPKSGIVGTAQYAGIWKVGITGAVTVGDYLMCNNDGTFSTATSTNARVAQALATGSGTGSLIAAVIGYTGLA